MTQISVSGGVAGTFQNPVAHCDQTHPGPNNQTTAEVSATGQVDGHPAEIDILDPAGPADFESQGHVIFYFHKSPDSTYGWTTRTVVPPEEAITSFNSHAGATFAVTLGLNMQFSSAAEPWDSDPRVTVTGTIVCP